VYLFRKVVLVFRPVEDGSFVCLLSQEGDIGPDWSGQITLPSFNEFLMMVFPLLLKFLVDLFKLV
jgi:hypothetical protein